MGDGEGGGVHISGMLVIYIGVHVGGMAVYVLLVVITALSSECKNAWCGV